MTLIVVLDYGIGNLRSAQKALEHVGVDARLTADPDVIAEADGLVLPGVGAFGRCMEALRASRLDQVALDAIAADRPFLGICIGMQMLYETSDESPDVRGLGVLRGRVRRLPDGVKRPQMQWNVLEPSRSSGLLAGLEEPVWVYFDHSYAAELSVDVVATCDYGGSLTAVVERGRLWATQFHPEKSSSVGLALLGNFVRSVEQVAASAGVIDLYPAIDLRGGRCVRLYQGDFDRETVFADDPPTQARLFADQGATWMHVVDLDAARTGEPVNRAVVAAIAAAVDVPVQSGGGVRSTDAARALSESGVRRVVIGTAALTHPELVAEVSGLVEVAVGLDVRGREVSVAGWQQGSGLALSEVLPRFEGAGASSVIVTQIEVDGTGRGPDLETYREVLALTELPVVASGGVGTLDHLHQLDALVVGGRSLSGVIVGRALYDGAFTLADALSAVS